MVLHVTNYQIEETYHIGTTFDGTCADSSNIDIIGFGWYAPYLPTWYSVAFINVSFQWYSALLSTFHPQSVSDLTLDDDIYPTLICWKYYNLELCLSLFQTQCLLTVHEFFESIADSALYARSANVFFGGNITFGDNIATRGAGLMLIDSSIMYLRPNTHIMLSRHICRRCYLCTVCWY